ncbi:MAG TPA: MFS transporter [Burkholderiaceae bacterium]|nr:MFS transporter [Burkholderiaceae bacterium]
MPPDPDSRHAWFRLWVSLALATIGGCGMYIVVVVLPAVQADFGLARGGASLPYMTTLIGFGIGGILMGRLTDRYGVAVPLTIGAVSLALGCFAAASAQSLTGFAIAHGLLIGMLGSSATFSPLVADISFWFVRRRGIAVAICASGNYLAGTLWPPIVEHFVGTVGWRQTYMGIGVFCLATMLPLAAMLRRRKLPASGARGLPTQSAGAAPREPAIGVAAAATVEVPAPPVVAAAAGGARTAIGLSPAALQTLLCIAGVACCVAMSMPQVHIVAYCGDLGYGAARGAQMLSLMFGFGIVSRLVSGMICDRIGGLRTLLLGSTLQGVALLLFLPFDSLVSLYVISALFGLFQGGIVPSYAIIVREYFAPRDAAMRVGTVLTATLFGMALGGWMSGAIFDLTGSYDAAFVNGIGWNLLNVSIALWLLGRVRRGPALRPVALG